MNLREWKRELRSMIPEMVETERCDCCQDEPYRTVYLGSFVDLDPCGRFHHILSPNGATRRCELFWERLNRAAEEVGGWIEDGEGDGTDVFFSMPLPEEEEGKDD